MQIAFCSDYPQVGTTCNTVAMATIVALEYNMRSLITNNHFNKNTLELSFIDKSYLNSDLTELSDTGIDALSRFVRSNKITKDNIANYTTTLLRKRLELLIGTTNTNKELYYKSLNDVIDMVLIAANQNYDLVFVDLALENRELAEKVLDYSDLIVINLNQNIHILENYFENHKGALDKSMFVLGRYDYVSRFNEKNIQRKYKLKDNIGIIPYNIEFADACCEGKAIDFFLKNIKADRDDNNYYFIQEVRRTAELMLKRLNIDISIKKLGD